MSSPFVKSCEKRVDQTNRTIGPAWFARKTQSWESGTELPLLIGGKSVGTLKQEVLGVIRGASEILAICSFIISDEELLKSILEASQRGVRVYVLTASKDRLAKDSVEEESRQKEMQEAHERMLNRLCSKTLLRDAQVHAKFILADPQRRGMRGILSTANFTTAAFSNPEIGINLTDEQISELFGVFVAAWWELGERELLQPKVLSTVRSIDPPASDLVTSDAKSLRHFTLTYPKGIMTLREEIRRLVRESIGQIFITTYGILDDDSLYNEIASVSDEGKTIRFLIRPRTKTTPPVHKLSEKGATVRGLDFLHAKVIATETSRGPEALVMTANLERISLQEGFEVGITLGGKEAKQVIDVLDHWWKNANWEYALSRRLGDHLGAYQVPNGKDFVKHEVTESKQIHLGELEVLDLTYLAEFMPDLPEQSDVRSVIYTWTTTPPILPKERKALSIEGQNPELRLWKIGKNRTVISVTSQEELDKVLAVRDRPRVPIVFQKD